MASAKKVTNSARTRKSRTVYSDELLAEILDRVAKGEALSKVCDVEGMPSRKAFFQWFA